MNTPKKLLLFAVILISVFWFGSARATTYTAVAGGGDWNTNATWGGSGHPIAGDTAIINGAVGNGNITVGTAAAAAVITFENGYTGSFILNADMTTTGSVTMLAGMTFTPNTQTWTMGTSTVTLTTGGKHFYNLTFDVGGTITLADTLNVDNTLTVSNTTTFATSDINCYGLSMTGNLLAAAAGRTINLKGGTWSGSGIVGGTIYSANLTITNSVTISGDVYFNNTPGVTATLNSGAAALTFLSATLHFGGITTFTDNANTWTNLTAVNATTLTLSQTTTISGNLTQGSSTLIISGTINVGGNLYADQNHDMPISGGTIVMTGTSGTATWTGANGAYVSSNLTFNAPGQTITIGSAVSYSGGTMTYTAGTIDTTTNNSTLTLAGSGGTLDVSAITWDNVNTIVGFPTTVTLGQDFHCVNFTSTNQVSVPGAHTVYISGNLTMTSYLRSTTSNVIMNGTGTWSGSGYLGMPLTFNTTGTITVSGTPNISGGTVVYTAGTMSMGTSTLTTSGANGGAVSYVNTAGMSWANINVATGGALTLQANLVLSGNLTIGSSTITNGGYSITVGGNVTNNSISNTPWGTSFTFILDGTSTTTDQTIGGSRTTSTFYNLTIDAGAEVTLLQTDTFTVTNTFTASGSVCSRIILNSSSGGNKAALNLSGLTVTVNYVDVTDISNSGTTAAETYGTLSDYSGWTTTGAGASCTLATITLSDATSVLSTTAQLNGNITATGSINPTVTMYWGTSDGGQTPASWANSSAPTSPPQPQGADAFYINVTGLSPHTKYYFSASATSGTGGSSWPVASYDFTTADITVTTAAVSGVTAPVTGAIPVTTLSDNGQYTGAVSWSGSPVTFAAGTIYIATITLSADSGYTFSGVGANFFTVLGASPVSNSADSGSVSATFPATATVPTITLSAATLVVSTTAQLNGNVTADGGDTNDITVTMYWGTSDGGQTPASWANHAVPTSPSQPQGVTAFYESLSGLRPGITYYFSAKAHNSVGDSWPASSLNFTTSTGITFNQEHFQIYQDNAGLNSATQYANQDINYNIPLSTNFRIRFEVANVGTATTSITRRLQFSKNGGAWTTITTSGNDVNLSNSANFSDGDSTTSRLTAVGTFIAGQGKYSTSDATLPASLTNEYYTEDEYCLEFQAGANGNTYQFRITNAATPLDSYAAIPSISAGVVSVFRIDGLFHLKGILRIK